MSTYLFTSESVTEGHPDKVADQISDAILDEMLAEDPGSRVACETMVTTGLALVAGEITTETYVEIPEVVRKTLRRIGYTSSAYGIDAHTCAVLSSIDKQSPDIAQGVDTGGAGDQGMMFGYASDETPEFMPAPLVFAHRITHRLAELRKSGELGWLRPDGKAQVSLEYDGDKPVRVHTVVVSTQHHPDVTQRQIHKEVREKVVSHVLPPDLYDAANCIFHINPTGKFEIGGPHGDAGLTGRKIIVAYAARWAAKNVVAAGLARRCEIQLAYAIGVVEPVSVHVDTFGTGEVPDGVIAGAVAEVFDFRPAGIIQELGLRDPIFLETAAYGHFGRESRVVEAHDRQVRLFPWEQLTRVDDMRSAVGG
jgi:S-adenosylmethionine synthetase